MERVHKILQFLRIEDDGELSFSFMSFALVAYLLISGKTVDLTSLGAFVTVLSSLAHKRHLENKLELAGTTETTNTTVTTIDAKVP